MAEARQRSEWDRAAQVCYITAIFSGNVAKGKKLKPEDFNPYSKRHEPIEASVDVLQALCQ